MVTTSLEQSSANTIPERSSTGLREQAIDILELLQLPAPRHLLQDMLACRGVRVDLGQLSRLCRVEERALRSDRAPASPWLVPAISCLDLSGIPGTLTCSTWTLEQRLVGMYTPRTRHLRVLLRLVDDAALLGSEPGQRLISRLAETVPGAMQRGRMRSPLEVRTATQAELAEIEQLDLTERRTTATRLSALAPAFQMWGQPALLSTATDAAGETRP